MKPPVPRSVGTRLYCDLPLSPGAEIALPEAAARHAVTVLRLQVGDTLNLFNGEGGEYRACLVAVSKRETRVRLIEFHAAERESPLEITLDLKPGERTTLAHTFTRPPAQPKPDLWRDLKKKFGS